MSVEQQPAEQPTEKQVKNSITIEEDADLELKTESSTVEETSTSSSSSSSESSEPTDTIEVDANAPEPPKGDLRVWFESLSNEERLAALGVCDGGFLTALLAVAPLCRPLPRDPEVAAYTSGYIDWEAMVPVKDFEIVESRRKRSMVDDEDCPVIDLSTRSEEMDEIARSDAYRIRNGLLSDDDNDGDAMDIADAKASELVKVFLDHVCVVFPSALQLITNDIALSKAEDAIPCICMNQKLLHALSGDEILLALDTLSELACRRPFLSDASSERLRSRFDDKMPLHAILCTKLSSAAASSRDSDSVTDGESLMERAQVLKDLVAHCQSSAFIPPTLGELSEFFLGPCLEKSFPDAPMEMLAFTPLSWLVQYATTRDKHSEIDFDALDKGLVKLLTKTAASKAKDQTDAKDLLLVESQPTVTQQVSGKKKKSKKKGRKNRLSSNAGTLASKETMHGKDLFAAAAATTDEPKGELNPAVSDAPARSNVGPGPAQDELPASNSDFGFEEEPVLLPELIEPGILGGAEESEGANDGDETILNSANEDKSTNKDDLQETVCETDDHVWETVEVKAKVTRKKAMGNGYHVNISNGGSRNTHHSSGCDYGTPADSHKKKNFQRSPVAAQKKAKASRRVVRDIIGSLLDDVDDEVHRKARQQAARKAIVAKPGVCAWKSGPPPVKPGSGHASIGKKEAVALPAGSAVVTPSKKDAVSASLRDVVLGRHTALVPQSKSWAKAVDGATATKQFSTGVTANKSSRILGNAKPPVAWKPDCSKANSIASNSLSKPNKATAADQNTATTYQETLSSSSLTNAALKSSLTNTEDRGSKSETSSGNTDEVAPYSSIVTKPKTMEKKAKVITAPPLPMLLNHHNASSANSSVASSLEAPHMIRHNHHHSSAPDVNDVGFHLLDVCDKLTRDMNLFMSRRALALNVRRQERGAILAALQDTVNSIWSGSGFAEMYGSCATQTDLPSSDIDVVVMGLDFTTDARLLGQSSPDISRSGSTTDILGPTRSFDELVSDDSRHVQPHQPVTNHTPLQMQRMIGAERVRRLAAELEAKPWAVKVNAIPTASVPVVKVLADPSKLLGESLKGDWLTLHQQHAPPVSDSGSVASQQSNESSQFAQHQPQHQYTPPWRGADIMNGLLSLDITFEGAGHGGIGSTEFSARVISDACQEINAHPDKTVLVQTMLVLKELLAQRKLNEPYSGGLSSYAVLLLVLALLQERAVIAGEIERAEQQKRAMSSDVGRGSFAPVMDADATPKAGPVKSPYMLPMSNAANVKGQKVNLAATHNVSSASSVSSWASVAKKTSAKASAGEKKAEKKQRDSKTPSYMAAASRSSPAQRPASNLSVGKKVSENNHTPHGAAAATSKPLKSLDVADGAAVVSPEAPLTDAPPVYPQGYNDIIEVLCSGRLTAGKLLMHFLLYYGQHFDAQTTAIDVSGKHARDYLVSPYAYFSPYIPRRSAGTIDPVTGMLTVDPIVVYDPLEGAENNNVARRCFAWSSVRWIFAQSYATLSSAVERSATPPSTPPVDGDKAPTTAVSDVVGDLMDPSSPLLSCLLSF